MKLNKKLLRLIQKILFYLSSFLPLYMLLVVQNLKVTKSDGSFIEFEGFIQQFFNSSTSVTIFWLGLLLLFILSLFGILLFFLIYSKNDGRVGTIQDTEFVREDTMGYIITYIVPLISMDIDSPRSLAINFLLFIIIGTFYVKNDQLFMNPIYNFCGYNVFSSDQNIYITRIRKSKLKIIAKRNIEVRKINLIGDIYVIKEYQKKAEQ